MVDLHNGTKLIAFNNKQLAVVHHSIDIAEDIVSEHYKMSSAQWLRNRYDVKTLAQLDESEIVFGPYAQIVKYHGKKNASQLGSGGFDFYKICLQDHAIIQAVKENKKLKLDPFMVYIMVHELIHVIRFGRFIQFFDASCRDKATEEAVVHRTALDILKKIKVIGMECVFEFYGEK